MVPEAVGVPVRYRSATVAALAALFACTLISARAAEQVVTFTGESLSARSVLAAVGDTILVILPMAYFSGRAWTVHSPTEPPITEMISDPVYLSNDPQPGAATGMRFQFRVTSTGSSELNFSLSPMQAGPLHSATLFIFSQ